MLSFILKLIPDQYKFGVAFKKIAWTIAKTLVALVAGTKIGNQVAPEQWLVVTEVSSAMIAGGMKLVHDWAKLKWPNISWL
jgi:uncharacterized membrane protein